MGASAAQEVFVLKMFFQLFGKKEMVTDAGRRQDLLVWLKELMLVGQSVFLMSRSQKGNVVGVEQYKEGQLSLSLMLSMVLENIKNSNRSMRQRCKYC